MELQSKSLSAVSVGDSRHSYTTLRVDMSALERSLKHGVMPSADIQNLLAIARKTVERANMVYND